MKANPPTKMPLEEALAIADAADVPDGAWMAMLVELLGVDEGVVCELLEAASEEAS